MKSPANSIVCDGCALPASPDHIAERIARLERATRFRPLHMGVLFLAFGPAPRIKDDFYGPPQSNDFFESLMDVLDIAPPTGDDSLKLADFQRKGHYLNYLSECPIPDGPGDSAATISALAPALIRRIRFNYKPKHIVLLGSTMAPMIEILEQSGLGPLLLSDRCQPFSVPVSRDLTARAGFRAALRTALSTGATSETRLSDYDRMQSNQA